MFYIMALKCKNVKVLWLKKKMRVSGENFQYKTLKCESDINVSQFHKKQQVQLAFPT